MRESILPRFNKIILITKETKSSWISCQLITSNLLKAYSRALENNNFEIVTVPETLNRYTAYSAIASIKLKKADLIVWLDHQPNPALFLQELYRHYKDISFDLRPKIIIHIFGDFILDCRQWDNCREALLNLPIHFVTASHKQQLLVESLFHSDQSIVSTRPFPVDESIFNFTNFEVNRLQVRDRLKLSPSEKVLIYTGRISLQKNVDALIKLFESTQIFLEEEITLLIVGPWDDILIPYFGKRGVSGSYFHYYFKTMKKTQCEKVYFLGNQSTDELMKLYHGADGFVSLSTYNDEDYGMAPAEALCSGLPCLLTDWAGYSSFANYSKSVSLVNVKKLTSRPSADSGDARQKLLSLIKLVPKKREERQKISEEAFLSLSIKASSQKLALELNEWHFGSVKSCADKFNNLCLSFKKNPNSPFKDELFQEIYEAY